MISTVTSDNYSTIIMMMYIFTKFIDSKIVVFS